MRPTSSPTTSGDDDVPVKRKSDWSGRSLDHLFTSDEDVPIEQEIAQPEPSTSDIVSSKRRSAQLKRSLSHSSGSNEHAAPSRRKSARLAHSAEQAKPTKRKSARLNKSSKYASISDNQHRPIRLTSAQLENSTDEEMPIKRKSTRRVGLISSPTTSEDEDEDEDMPTKRKSARLKRPFIPSTPSNESISDSSSPGSPLAASYHQRMLASKQGQPTDSPSFTAESDAAGLLDAMRPSRVLVPSTAHNSGEAAYKGPKRDSLNATGAQTAASGSHGDPNQPTSAAEEYGEVVVDVSYKPGMFGERSRGRESVTLKVRNRRSGR